jgi:hypothetical protein
MDEWTPVLALPNLDMSGTLECPYANWPRCSLSCRSSHT